MTTSEVAAASEAPAAALVYLNPTGDGRIRVLLPHPVQGELAYTLISLLGAEVAEGNLNLPRLPEAVELDFSRRMPATGVYYLRLRSQGLQAVGKVVRQ